jgi:hypothetical protein
MASFSGGRSAERFQIQPFGVTVPGAPTDLNGAALVGDEITMKNVLQCSILVCFNDGTATSGDVTVLVEQATALGGTYKALSALQTGRIWTKTHATTLAAVPSWTQITKATAASTFTGTAAGDLGSSSGALVGIYLLDLLPSDFDTANNFDVLRATINATTSSKLANAFYICEMKHNVAAASLETILS